MRSFPGVGSQIARVVTAILSHDVKRGAGRTSRSLVTFAAVTKTVEPVFYRLATASRAKVCRSHSVGRDSPEHSKALQAYSEVDRSNHCIHSSHGRDWGSTAPVGILRWLGHFEQWQP
jgi:hypothetical protein